MNSWDVLIVGGGAAGFFAAIVCAEQVIKQSGDLPRVLVIDKARKTLSKVRISGGGRCNVTNACFDPAQLVAYYPRGAEALRSAFTRFQPADTMTWFEEHGVRLKTETDGRVFPVSDSAESIAACLEQTASSFGVTLWHQASAESIEISSTPNSDRFKIKVRRITATNVVVEETLSAKQILLSTGGDHKSLGLAAGLGHTIKHPVPSLFTFNIPDDRLTGLAGITVPTASLRLMAKEGNSKVAVPPQQGPLLITHWGLSGPAVLRLSAWGARWLHEQNYQARLVINWLHPHTPEQILSILQTYKESSTHRKKKALTNNPFIQLPVRLWQRLAEKAGLSGTENWADLSKSILHKLSNEISTGVYSIQGKGIFKEEFVTCGGISLQEVNFKTMQSRLIPGFYFAGEVLDIDGLTGGFNFQNAWTTAWIAGNAIAQQLSER